MDVFCKIRRVTIVDKKFSGKEATYRNRINNIVKLVCVCVFVVSCYDTTTTTTTVAVIISTNDAGVSVIKVPLFSPPRNPKPLSTLSSFLLPPSSNSPLRGVLWPGSRSLACLWRSRVLGHPDTAPWRHRGACCGPAGGARRSLPLPLPLPYR